MVKSKELIEWEAKMAREKAEVYKNIPPEFINYIESAAYDRGHSAGQGECDAIAAGMAREMKPYIDEFVKNMKY